MRSLPLDNPSRRIGAPEGWDHSRDGLCHTLEVWDVDGWMVSTWEPSPEERERIAAGRPIVLYIMGSRHPVVSLSVAMREDKPQEDGNG